MLLDQSSITLKNKSKVQYVKKQIVSLGIE